MKKFFCSVLALLMLASFAGCGSANDANNDNGEVFADYVNPDIDGVKEGVTGGGQLCSAGIYAEKVVRYAPDI